MDRLRGRTALITGSTSNIGRAIATAFAAEGAHVVVTGRDRDRGAAIVRALRERGGDADFVRAELDGAHGGAQALAEAAGPVDILVNNAGIYPPDGTLTTDEETFDRIVGVNLRAPYFLTAALVPGMIARGGGVVINLGSWIARLGVPRGALYSATKGALETLTRAWSAEFGARGVRVNAISPGVIKPVELEVFAGEELMRGTPAGRGGHPDAIAAAAVYLASDDAEFVHGTVLDVDGGRTGVYLSA
ncbi:SDR family NAD(P)-dependent oxidoreductase [Pseudonocardia sp. WMMC193]|uniref:SDR family NAD(P)-dependent oxidoreductase n=1 Tax=Pseudonocardia sp. WMMC193 TaxID=2911965 RepID=UPI001F29C0E5|nr:SDR family oxidoreductase [Pseudonocardia sp. WMMC193]MCF7553650.1 SDR family oxidoreductase [Pseudonocardia sp. WMMC193]